MDLSAALEVDHGIRLERGAISEIETGIWRVSNIELKAFAGIFGVSVEALLVE